MATEWKKYLFWFAHEHVDFRMAEMESILDMFKITVRTVLKPKEHPFWIVELPSVNAARQIASRSVSLRCCLELWAMSKDLETLHSCLKSYTNDNIEQYRKQSFKINVKTFCKHFSQKEKVGKIESFNYLPLEGSVKLDNPELTLYYFEYYGLDPNCIPQKPFHLFFGRWITDGQRDLIQKFSLKTRKFIGNTSMDPQLSLMMANQAQVQNGDLVLDPFVGTGSLLIAASQFGGYTLGTDIDYLMLHGRTRPSRISQKSRDIDENVAANMNQYGITSYFVDVVVADFSCPLWRENAYLDAIITDPPYGVRESTERVGSTKSGSTIEAHQVETHIPSKVVYDLNEIFQDLLNFSARNLKISGRLVCWFPLFTEDHSEEFVPTNPCLQLLASSEQILSANTSRLLLTYRKVREPQT